MENNMYFMNEECIAALLGGAVARVYDANGRFVVIVRAESRISNPYRLYADEFGMMRIDEDRVTVCYARLVVFSTRRDAEAHAALQIALFAARMAAKEVLRMPEPEEEEENA
jgi:hypothetical protein